MYLPSAAIDVVGPQTCFQTKESAIMPIIKFNKKTNSSPHTKPFVWLALDGPPNESEYDNSQLPQPINFDGFHFKQTKKN